MTYGLQVPPVTRETVRSYLSSFDKEPDEKAEFLYHERFLLCVCMAPSTESKTYVIGRCAAEMKKSLSYQVDIVLDSNHGAIMECQCECAVGSAPGTHCKHVQCVLLAMESFTMNRSILTQQTCTQRLQTFHHCKKFKGSPVKTASLSLRKPGQLSKEVTEKVASHTSRRQRKVAMVVGPRKLAELTSYDPCPAKFVQAEGYVSHVQNLCINYHAMNASSSVTTMPFL